MSIDAIINKVIEDDNTLILDLMSREVGGPRGQSKLIIHDPTHVPVAGQEIWGSSNEVIIEPGQGVNTRKKYKRWSYVHLYEDFHKPVEADNCYYCALTYHPMLTFTLKDRLNPENKPRQIWACEYTFTFERDGTIKSMELGAICLEKAIKDGYQPRHDLTPSR